MAAKFYTFYQNRINGCGWEIDEEEHTSRYVIIEADSADDANQRARKLGMGHEARWPKVGEASSDEVPSVFGEPIGALEQPPDRFNVTVEIDRPLATVHYQDGHVETFTPRIRLVGDVVEQAREHTLVEHDEFHGWRHRLKCTACGAEFTVPRRTDLGTITIAGCRGKGGTHPADTCECHECEPV